MKKNYKILVLTALFLLGCEEKEVLPCNTKVDNGITYSDGKVFHGDCHMIYENEFLWKTRTYKRGKLYKEISYHIPEGGIDYIGYRDRDGNVHGDFKKYYKNGNLELEGKLIKGYYNGDWDYFNEEGELIRVTTYNMGEVVDSIEY
jgi:antitoxin component YwqK of YwqJK toxin-antitoxin module